MKRLVVLAALLFCLAPAQAQTYVQLILDASGSMWNKLSDGEYRIVAAKDVLASFVSSLPADAELNVGLRVYGSRIRALDAGACEDSELFVPMAGLEREALLRTVQGAQAVGSTPIAYSLEQAAQDFPAEGRKLIVLVTDGEESCGGDVRGVLEGLRAQGIDIELKIIGFDLDDRAIASFEGLGDFENATSAGELAAALGRAVAGEQTEAYPVTVTLTRQGEPAEDGLAVTFTEAVSGAAYDFAVQGPGELGSSLPAGLYTASVQDAFSDVPQEVAGLSVTPEGENAFAFELAPEAEVTLTVAPSAPVTGSSISIAFENAPPGQNWITVVPADAPESLFLAYATVTGASGTAQVQIPGDAVALEARYHLVLPEGGSRVVGRSDAFTPVAAEASITVPAEVAAGTAFDLSWTGPDNPGDYLTLVPAAAAEGTYREYRYTRDGSPLRFTAPMEPGSYELRYQSDGSTGLIARAPLTVTATEVSVTAPETLEAGKPFQVAWVGPDGQGDYVTVVLAGAADGTYNQYKYTRDGSTLSFTAPIAPGVYEVRYQSDREGGVFARQAVTVTATALALDAPEQVAAGTAFEVAWTGPNGQGDYLTVVPASARPGAYENYRYTAEGSPLTLIAGLEPGDYEVRYQSDRESGVVFASQPIIVTALEVSLDAPDEVAAGESFEVSWTGPDGPGDYLTVVPAGAPEGEYANYRYTREGPSLSFTAPHGPGAYEIRYQSDRVSRVVFATRPITVR